MTALLVVIAVLLAFVIVLLPPGGEPSPDDLVQDTPEEVVPDVVEDRPRSDEDSGGGQSPESADDRARNDAITPDEEGSPTGSDDTPWWLPLPAPEVTPGTLFVLLDDAGESLAELEPFLATGMPVTVAVLPRLAYSSEASLATVTSGNEVILHQPMEPISDGNPGPGAIYENTPIAAVPGIVRENLATVPGAVGVNNHMGSLVTQNAPLMRAVLGTVGEDRLFYLDSRTTPHTVGAAVARDLGVPFAERHIFLDNEREPDAIFSAVQSGLERAREGKDTVMIGHVTVPELALVLEEVWLAAGDAGYRFGWISEAIARNGATSASRP